jgi:hypothetical protein
MNLPVSEAFTGVLTVVIILYMKTSHTYQTECTATMNSNNSIFYIPGIDEGLWLMGGEAEGDM